jgi:hypothetical protein
MAGAAHAVGQHAAHRQAGPVLLQAQGQGAEGLGHGRGLDHRQHRQAEGLGQVGAAGPAVEQAHHALDQHDVMVLRGLGQQAPAVGLAAHPQVQLPAGLAAGAGVDHRVQKVRPGLEDPHPQALARPQPGQGRGDGGLALAGGGALTISARQRSPTAQSLLETPADSKLAISLRKATAARTRP